MKSKIWNNYELGSKDFGEPLKLEYGLWAWGKCVMQRFGKDGAEKIKKSLDAAISRAELGIPVYQGHPDVPDLASRYPDKGAIGWITKMEVKADHVLLWVEWDRFPGKGFGWMSPYWGGSKTVKEGGVVEVEIDEIYSVGLVNNPNIRNFRLPNEEIDFDKQKGETMTLEELLKLLGFEEGATSDEIRSKAAELVSALESVKTAEAKAQNECAEAKKKADEAVEELENCKKELESAKAELANSKAEIETARTELANSKEELEKLKSLKTVSVTMKLENQKKATDDRLQLVNEIMESRKTDFDNAWAEAKARKPELFA